MRRSAAPSAHRSGDRIPPPLASAPAASDAENVPPVTAAAVVPVLKKARRAFDAPTAVAPPRAPAAPAPGPAAAAASDGAPAPVYYSVLYTKRSGKKRANKTFADAYLEVKGSTVTLWSDEGKALARTKLKGMQDAPEGATGEVGGWEFEVVEAVPAERWASGAVFLTATEPAAAGGAAGGGGAVFGAGGAGGGAAYVPRAAGAPRGGFKAPAAGGPGAALAAPPPPPRPLHDPDAPGAVVLSPAGPKSVAVVLDPYLARRLRPHQVDAVRFLWGRATAPPLSGVHGSVLADSMGLGKSLSTIALLHTLLKQGPAGRPLARRALVVCPASLVGNWAAEIKKWLGDERMMCATIRPGGDADADARAWRAGVVRPVLVASYEAVRRLGPALTGAVDVLVCDEAHRLKAAGGSATQAALAGLRAPRCVLLSGTPLQNNLDELWAMLDFVAPGLLGPLPTFQRVFAAPIAASRDAAAPPAVRALGAARAAELADRMAAVVLRRTSAVLAASLPPLHVVDVFCGLAPGQEAAYRAALAAGDVARLLGGGGGGGATAATTVLPLIGRLRALCVAPCLGGGRDAGVADGDAPPPARALLPPPPDLVASSGKLTVLDALLRGAASAGERVVAVSTSTAVLDVVAAVARGAGVSTARIDGKTPAGARQDVVDAFNRAGGAGVMLLSARAGGAGLNLVGASRLIMCDLDWNPAVNAQAMARIWRDGQRAARCVVYRLHATGALDEKLFQRVMFKQGLACALEAGGDGGGGRGAPGGRGGRAGGGAREPAFTRDELRALFSLDTRTACATRDLMLRGGGGGGGRGGGGDTPSPDASWTDGAPAGFDALLDAAVATGAVTWARVADGAAELASKEEEEEEGKDDGGGDNDRDGGGGDHGEAAPPPAAVAGEEESPPLDDVSCLELE